MRSLLLSSLVVCALACELVPAAMDDAGMDGGVGEDGEVLGIPMTLTQSVPRIDLPAGSENAGHCFSWTLNNETSIWVNKVRFEATLGLHHSNWFFVRETTFPGDDGLWPCPDRTLDSVAAPLPGVLLLVQSTPAAAVVLAFPERVAIPIPPRSSFVRVQPSAIS